MLFIVKRVVFVNCVFHIENPALSISIVAPVIFSNICYLVAYKPYEDETLLKFEIFNDIITLLFV